MCPSVLSLAFLTLIGLISFGAQAINLEQIKKDKKNVELKESKTMEKNLQVIREKRKNDEKTNVAMDSSDLANQNAKMIEDAKKIKQPDDKPLNLKLLRD